MLYGLVEQTAPEPGTGYDGRPAEAAAALDAAMDTLAAYDSLWSTELPLIATLGEAASLIGRAQQAQEIATRVLDLAVAGLEKREPIYRALSGDEARTEFLAPHLRWALSLPDGAEIELDSIRIVGSFALQSALAKVRAMRSSLKPAALVWLGLASMGDRGD